MSLPKPGVIGGVVVGDDPAVWGDVAVGPLHEAVRRPRLRLGRRRVGVAVAGVVKNRVVKVLPFSDGPVLSLLKQKDRSFWSFLVLLQSYI